MPHRRFHRVLGETSLELKCLALFGAFSLLVFSANFISYWRVTEKVVTEQNPKTGQVMAERGFLVTHWEKLESASQNPGFAEQVRYLRKRAAAQAYGEQADKGKKGEDSLPRFISPDPNAPAKARPRDEREREILEEFTRAKPGELAGPDGVEYRERFSADKYEYYQPFRAEENCSVVCHFGDDRASDMLGDPRPGAFGAAAPGGRRWYDGEVMGVAHVTISNDPVQRQISLYWNALLALAIITGFLAMIAFYVTIRYLIVRPLKHLRDVSDAVSHGNVALRAEIRTGDEFESLGTAFNRMLRHLVTTQDELRQVNVDLDAKVDELAQLNMQLYEMNRVKSDFLATMSHELRTPLNSILGFSDVLGSINSLDERQKRYVENIQKSGRVLLEMINNILDLAKIESGKMEIRLGEFGIEQVIAAQCDMARPLTEKKNIDLETQVEPGLPPMVQDQARVQQILNNLLSNAIKFTPEGGRVLVSAQRSERGELVLRVVDTGVGIAEEDQQVIFEKFRQGRTAMPGGDAMTREYSGTGLGLSIVKELSRLLEGEVSVESELGTGSAFTVRLPWRLEKKPRLDSPLAAGLEKFAKVRIDPGPDPSESLSAGSRSSRGEGAG